MANVEDVFTKQELREFHKRAVKALKQIKKSMAEEPSVVIIEGEPNKTSESSIEEIVKWLFHRRQEDGNQGK